MKKIRRPKGWPTIEGRPATPEEIAEYCAKVEAHYTAPRALTAPHFCKHCTQPLEHEPCHVCWSAHFEKQVRDYRTLIEAKS
jgi:hypothetical protein